MTAQRSGNLPTLHFYEDELLHKVRSDRRLAAGLFDLFNRVLRTGLPRGFQGNEASGKCDLNGGTSCPSVASSSRASP